MEKRFGFALSLLSGHAAFNRRPWHEGAPRVTIEDRLVALYRHWRGDR